MPYPYEIVTQDNFKPGIGQRFDEEDMVERDTYRSVEQIVKEFVSAGERLAEFRKEEFDLPADEEEVELPINRSQDFDMATASMERNRLIDKMRQADLIAREDEKNRVKVENEINEVKK